MSMRRFLNHFVRRKSDRRHTPDNIAGPVISRRPGMHQAIDEPDPLSFSAEDLEFLRHLGIHIRCDGVGRESHRPAIIAHEKP
jgi:hypothetical protein